MLIYLDSAHFDLLERTAAADAEAFWSVWHTHGCELAISLHHLQEIGQLSDRRSAERRLAVLKRFQVIRGSVAEFTTVLSLEAQFQLLHLAGCSVDIPRSAAATLFAQTSFDQLKASLDLQSVFHQFRGALQMGADAENLSKQAVHQEPKLKPNAPIEPSQIYSIEAETAFEAAIADYPDEVVQMMRTMFNHVRSTLAEKGNLRKALEHLHGVDRVKNVDAWPDADLASISIFVKKAQEEAGTVAAQLGIEHSEVERLIQHLDPYQAPGLALQLAAQRGRRPQPKEDKPSDQIDVAHLCFAPYVDLAFVDKRTFGFLAQEARDRPNLLPPAYIKNIRRAGTLEHITELITAHQCERV